MAKMNRRERYKKKIRAEKRPVSNLPGKGWNFVGLKTLLPHPPNRDHRWVFWSMISSESTGIHNTETVVGYDFSLKVTWNKNEEEKKRKIKNKNKITLNVAARSAQQSTMKVMVMVLFKSSCYKNTLVVKVVV